MSTPNEVLLEPLVSDGSNYASWSAHILNVLRTMGQHVERILVASILPPKFDIDHIDWKNITQEELECLQLNSCVTNFLWSWLCKDIQDTILEMKDVRNDAHLIWVILKNAFVEETHKVSESIEGCSTSSAVADPQMTTSEESISEDQFGPYSSHHHCFMAMSEEELNLDSDDDSDDEDEELMLELRKMNKKSRKTIFEMMKKVVRQDQEVKRQKKLLNKKDEEIKCLALVE